MERDCKNGPSMGLQATLLAGKGGSVISPVIQGHSLSNVTINITGSQIQNDDKQRRASSADQLLIEEVKSHHKSMLLRKFEHVIQCVARNGDRPLLKDLFTEVLMTQGESDEPLYGHDSKALKNQELAQTLHHSDIFKVTLSSKKRVRTVLTTGIAGIGKTMTVQKFVFDWASGETNQEFDFVCVFPLRELNLVRTEISIQELLCQYYPHLRRCDNVLVKDMVRFLFIFDGLDESKYTLDFFKCPTFQEVSRTAAMDVLLTNIVRGDLLHGACVWITSRCSATCRATIGFMDRTTEIQGFDDKRKEEYFRKWFQDKANADEIIAHIKSHRSLHLMCNVPAFCWVLASVFSQTVGRGIGNQVSMSLAEIYTRYLLVLLTSQNQKYSDGASLSKTFSLMESNRDAILNMGRLAFENLEKGNVVFYERDLRQYGICLDTPSFYSGVCREIFQQDSLSLHESVYSFTHLTLQEYFAALYVFACQRNERRNVLKRQKGVFWLINPGSNLFSVFSSGLRKSIQNRNGHLDIFVRFLLGLSTKQNQNLLDGLFVHSEEHSDVIQQTAHFIKDLIRKDLPPERCINLFHCLNELGDLSLVEELKTALDSGKLSREALLPGQYSALAFILQTSQGEVDCLNLRSFRLREQGVLRMLPIAKHYKRVILSHCCLTSQSCADVSHLLMSQHSQLTELELTWNILMDAGIKLLCSGLTHPNCRLRKLGLRQCGLTSLSCEDLAMVLTTTTSLRELELCRNLIGDRGVSQLSIGLCHPTCRLQKLKLQGCELTAGCVPALVSCLSQSHSSLRELNLGHNNQLGDEGVKLLVSGLRDPCCHLETLCLHSCGLTAASCEAMALVLASEHSSLRVLVLALNALGDEGLNALCVGLQSPHSKLEELGLEFCTLTSAACKALASAISACHSRLRSLDLGTNILEDSGVSLLCSGLTSPHCKIQKLVLRNCRLTSKSCECLASAIQSSALELSELNLTKNRLTDAAIEALIPALREPSSKLCNVNLLGAQVSWALKGELASVLAEVRQSGKDISFQLEPNKTL